MPREKSPDGETYRAAGVDLEAGQEVVERIRSLVQSTYSPSVLTGSHGSFGGFFSLREALASWDARDEPVLVGATDGVGTKLKLAFGHRLDTVGIDLVAMCVNDLVVSGARPLFFLDYVATGKLEPPAIADAVAGIAQGCREAGCALIGGETAEMPGFYPAGEFDLAGFAVGLVARSHIIDGRRVRAGDAVIGLPSSGVHANGFSLVRKIFGDGESAELDRSVDELGASLREALLVPTRIYVRPVLQVIARFEDEGSIHALAHITGGGLIENLPRVLPTGCGVVLDRSTWEVPPILSVIQRRGRVPAGEMDRVFNQGLGMVAVADRECADAVVAEFRQGGEPARIVGEVVTASAPVTFR